METKDLERIANMRMPFGKYKGVILMDIPEHYVFWYYRKGLSDTSFDKIWSLLYEIRINGLMELVRPLRNS